eukprot:scaffold14872_cov84-Isochrysis_galbana.AAC.1
MRLPEDVSHHRLGPPEQGNAGDAQGEHDGCGAHAPPAEGDQVARPVGLRGQRVQSCRDAQQKEPNLARAVRGEDRWAPVARGKGGWAALVGRFTTPVLIRACAHHIKVSVTERRRAQLGRAEVSEEGGVDNLQEVLQAVGQDHWKRQPQHRAHLRVGEPGQQRLAAVPHGGFFTPRPPKFIHDTPGRTSK